jgi:hypothetical protein
VIEFVCISRIYSHRQITCPRTRPISIRYSNYPTHPWPHQHSHTAPTRVHPPMTPLSEKSWQISQSRDFLDWDALRLQSLAPGGFGPARANIWYLFFARNDMSPSYYYFIRPKLLHVHMNTLEIPEGEPHRDERQIRLDTDRSFVLYPVGDAHPYLTPPPLSFTRIPQTTVQKMIDLHVRPSSTNSLSNFSGDTPG